MYNPVPQPVGEFFLQIGPTEILLLALLALLLFAPRKLPELAKAIREAADILRGESREGEGKEGENPGKASKRSAEKS